MTDTSWSRFWSTVTSWFTSWSRFLSRFPESIQIGFVLGAIALPGCFAIATYMGGERWLNILICIFGSIAGWSTGMLMSPHPNEKEKFVEFRQAISAFITGFVLAKFDAVFPAGGTVQNGTLMLGRVLLFMTTFLLCANFTYVGRTYQDKKIPV